MDIRFQLLHAKQDGVETVEKWYSGCIIVPVLENGSPLDLAPLLAGQEAWLAVSPALADTKGRKHELTVAYGPADSPISRVVFVGLGAADKLTREVVRDAVAVAIKSCHRFKAADPAMPLECLSKLAELPKLRLSSVGGQHQDTDAVTLQSSSESSACAAALLEDAALGALLAFYACDEYRSKKDETAFTPLYFSFLASEPVDTACLNAADRAEALASGITLARNLINGPANVITPERMEAEAKARADLYGFKFTSYGREYLEKEGFGAFAAVAAGSELEPRLVILEYAPKGCEEQDPIVFVGKGVTFDTGGISLKPAAKMSEMKTDMAGAGTVMGLFEAIGKSAKNEDTAVKRRIIGVMPCTDNMPDGKAVRPGDIVKTLSGKTVEITNTDAEGRLLLCDCLTMAQKLWKPAALIDMATLTGACVVALGEKTAGLFSNSGRLRRRIMDLGELSSERFWPLPVYDEDIEGLKSETADLNNTGPREGGALFAALFLKQFIEDGTDWAHLDIAGPARAAKASATCPVGASGVSLRTLYKFVSE